MKTSLKFILLVLILSSVLIAGCGSDANMQNPPSIEDQSGMPSKDSVKKTGPNISDVKPPFQDSAKEPPFD